MENIRVQIEERDDIGLVIDRWILDDTQFVTADFGLYKVSAPAEFFTIVTNS